MDFSYHHPLWIRRGALAISASGRSLDGRRGEGAAIWGEVFGISCLLFWWRVEHRVRRDLLVLES